jgi:hypothetical protein
MTCTPLNLIKLSRTCSQIKNAASLFGNVFVTFCDVTSLYMIVKLTPCVSKSMDSASMNIYGLSLLSLLPGTYGSPYKSVA